MTPLQRLAEGPDLSSSSSSSSSQIPIDPSSSSFHHNLDSEIGLILPPLDDEVLPDHDNETTRIYVPPPPHIADRFYRPSTARRRSSAASSRRNSMSSAHSRCSSALGRHGRHHHRLGIDQSKYVAQHLRRASFLAERQARLADRAAHAEKVRLRAAMAKSSHRDASAHHERAMAAQITRQRNLAEIAATCAEEVKKAKTIAESMREKREQELARMRAQIEERMAEAEKRREELLSKSITRRQRDQSVVARKTGEAAEAATSLAKEMHALRMTPEMAAARIQWWWRAMRRRDAVNRFSELGLVVDKVRQTAFETVTELLLQEDVLKLTRRVLRICGLREGEPGSVDEMAAVRSFLSAFMILGHPQSVLNTGIRGGDGDQQDQAWSSSSPRLVAAASARPTDAQVQELVTKTRDLLICFENILSRLTSANNYTPPLTLRKALPEAYASFHNAFIVWKSRDLNAVLETLLMQFVELDAIWRTVSDTNEGAVMESYRESIKENQVKLLVRIKRLAGDKAKKLVADAVRKARRRESAAKKPSGDMKPRGADSSPLAAGEAASLGQDAAGAGSGSGSSAAPIKPPSSSPLVSATANPLRGFLPDNRTLMHELAINHKYEVPEDEFKEYQATAHTPLLMQMRLNGDNNDDANFAVFLILANTVKQKLQRMVKPGNSMHTLIDEMLDSELAERQFRVGSFSYDKYFTTVTSILAQLCAPFRDHQLRELANDRIQRGSVVDRAEALSGFVDAMQCDHVNYLLRLMASQLVESAPGYETKMFADELAERGGEAKGLQRAEAAWRAARTKVLTEAGKRDPAGVNHNHNHSHPRSRPSGDRIYAQMLVDAFTQPLPVTAEDLPEMLRLDAKRAARISATVRRIVTVGAILLQCKNLLKRDVRSPWKSEASRITAILEAAAAGPPGSIMAATTTTSTSSSTASALPLLLPSVNEPATMTARHASLDAVMAALEAGRSMPAATRTQLRALANKVLLSAGDADTSPEPREPVLRLLLTRVRGNLLTRLLASGVGVSAGERVREASAAGERLVRLGLAEAAEAIREVAEELAAVGRADKAAHTGWWETVVSRVAEEPQQD